MMHGEITNGIMAQCGIHLGTCLAVSGEETTNEKVFKYKRSSSTGKMPVNASQELPESEGF